MKKNINWMIGLGMLMAACSTPKQEVPETSEETPTKTEIVQPVVVTDTTQHDTDDPAIWVHPEDPSQSLVLGTDKDEDGALYAFNLEGKIVGKVPDLQRPNNVDVEYGLMLNGAPTDIAVVSERFTHKVRVFSLPDLQPIDGGGIPAFEGETGEEFRDLMGIAAYKRPSDGQVFVVVGRKNGPTDGSYLWQYALSDNGSGVVMGELVRKFGNFSGKKEIEAIAVDDEMGFIYYSDETVGVRKYYADPESGNEELALFATEGFADDHEGISIYPTGAGTGYILVSDQQADQFQVFSREGTEADPHQHELLKVVKVATSESDGSEVSPMAFNEQFAKGLFVAMSDDKTFQFYRWEDIAGEELNIAEQGELAVKE